MRTPLAIGLLIAVPPGCTPVPAIGVGIDAVIPEQGDVDVSVGGVVWDAGAVAFGTQADLPVSERTAITGSFGLFAVDNPSSLSRLGVRTVVTEPEAAVAVAILVTASMPTWVVHRATEEDPNVFRAVLQAGGGGYVGGAVTLPKDGWRVGLATTLGTVVSGPAGQVSPLQWQLVATWRIQLFERAYIAGEGGLLVLAHSNPSANAGILVRLGGDLNTRNKDGR